MSSCNRGYAESRSVPNFIKGRIVMRHLGCTGIVLIIMLTLASASASAMELPDIHPLPESETVTAEGVIKGAEAAVIETEIGEKLTAEELRPLFRFEKLSSLGSGDLHFS